MLNISREDKIKLLKKLNQENFFIPPSIRCWKQVEDAENEDCWEWEGHVCTYKQVSDMPKVLGGVINIFSLTKNVLPLSNNEDLFGDENEIERYEGPYPKWPEGLF
jgi:hypothetical protein